MKGYIKNSIFSTKVFIKDNTLSIIFITLFTIGSLVGTLALNFGKDTSASLIYLLTTYFKENANLSVIALFSRNLISALVYLGVMYIGGLCAIGLPVVGIIPLLKGIALGMIISYQYVYNGIKGFLYALVIILLPQAVLLAILSIAYGEGIYMSLTVSNGIFNGKPRETKYRLSFMTFSKRYLIFAVGIVIVSIIEAVLDFVFSKVL